MALKDVIGSNLKLLREKAGLSQAAIAKEIGISQAAIAQFEKGKNCPSEEVLVWYADKFEVSMDWIFGRKTPIKLDQDSEEYKDLQAMVEGIVAKMVNK